MATKTKQTKADKAKATQKKKLERERARTRAAKAKGKADTAKAKATGKKKVDRERAKTEAVKKKASDSAKARRAKSRAATKKKAAKKVARANSRNASPDIGFDASLNPYRGCEHGCSYCYARPTHEYLGFSPGLDFESRIMVKRDAANLLRKELSKRTYRPELLSISGVTDPYQPVERKLEITRGCLEVLAEFRNPAAVVTKNALITRDLDHLGELAAHEACGAFLSVTTLDTELGRTLEPRASSPRQRLEAIRRLSEAGIPTGVMVAPVIPGLNDHEIPGILGAAADAGAKHAGYIVLRMPLAVSELFESWLERHYPGKREKVLGRLRSMHGGKTYSPEFGKRMTGSGPYAEEIEELFRIGTTRARLNRKKMKFNTAAFRRVDPAQMEFEM